MGDYRAYDPTRQARRPQAHDRCARDFERHFLRAVDGLPMAGAAQGPATEEHGMGLFRSMDLGWYAGAHSSRALCGGTRAGGTGGKPDHSDHRQPECQGRAKRGAVLDPQGFDAGKKVTGRKRHILVDTLGLLLSVAVHPANIQDRNGVELVLDEKTRALWPFIVRSLPTPATREPAPRLRPQRRAAGSSKSSSAPNYISSWFFRSVGSSRGPWHGSAETVA